MSEYIVVKRKLIWEIKRKNEINKYKVGESIKSELFDVIVDGKLTQWYLQLFPNGQANDSQNYFSLFLYPKNPSKVVFDSTYKFGILSNNMDFNSGEFTLSSKEFEDNLGWGLPKLIQRGVARQPDKEYFVDDKITIFCELTISASRGQTKAKIADDSTNFLNKMFQNESLMDCKIISSDGTVLKCHKAVLAARSHVFYSMFAIEMKEAQSNVVEINDFGTETLTQMLRFAYGQTVENLEEIAHDLVFIAEKYAMKELKEQCMQSLIENANQENVLDSLLITEKLTDAESLFNKCVAVVVSNYKVLSESAGWQALTLLTKEKILGHLIPYYSEEQIYKSTLIFVSHN